MALLRCLWAAYRGVLLPFCLLLSLPLFFSRLRTDHIATLCAPLQIATSLMGAEAAAAADPDKLRQLKADVAMELNALRNTAYAGGFAAAKGAVAAAASGLFA